MPNSNTIAQAKIAGGYGASDTLGASSTSETQFTKGSKLIVLAVPGAEVGNMPIRIKMWGRVTGGTTTNFTASVYNGKETTIGSNTSIATTGAKAVNSTSGSFLLKIEGVWDSTSKMLMGNMTGHVAGTTVAQAIISSVATPNATPADNTIYLSSTLTFSGSHASNAAVLDGFEVDRM